MFDFDLILGLFLNFLGPNVLFLGSMWGSENILGSTHVVEQLSCSMFPSILIFDFDLILGPFLTLWGPNELFSYIVDDLTLGESINLPEKLIILPESEIKRPETYHECTGHILPKQVETV